ncbi:MAG TPA: SMC family ATPase [Thermomicrobiales bacterium]|nr:SMC family ATPase [Thermomicrobiales bacterium]
MIPTRLTLRNFMCYRDEATLDLRTVRVACVSGDNGAGKSALLDAITWALWGKTRASAERELMTLGATEMSVAFQFLLGDQEYRVLRYRRRRARSQDVAQLEVQLRPASCDPPGLDGAGEGEGWRPISGDTLAQTQALLTKALGMDYDTFINSAFVLQGRADEFTTKGPTERKQVLADILGLARYDELEERAKALRRERDGRRREIDRGLELIGQELARRPAVEAELTEVANRLIAVMREVDELSDALEALREHVVALEAREAQAREAEAQRDTYAREAGALRERAGRQRGHVADLQAIIAEGETIRRDHAALAAVEERERALNDALGRLNDLLRRHRDAEKRVETARNLRLQELHALEHKLKELSDQQAQAPAIEARYDELHGRLAALQAERERGETLQQSVTSATEEAVQRKAENAALKREMERLKERQRQIADADASCPLCRRPLGPGERRHIHDEYQAEGTSLGDQFRANRERIAVLDREVAAYQEQLGRIEAALREQRALDRELGQVTAQLQAARDAGDEYAAKAAERDRLVDLLDRQDFAHDAQRELADLNAAIAALAYDADEHQRVRVEVATLKPAAQRLSDLEHAEGSLATECQRLAEDEAMLASRETDREAAEARAVDLRAGLADLPALRDEYGDRKLDLIAREREKEELTRRHGGLEEALRRLADREEEGRGLRAERARVAEEEGIYRQLAEAFGKRGIQAMIIEAAIPELQDEANAILANMPGNTMRVEFRTQRETQKGDTVEALDIMIGDEAGQRDYAMYSGGESFRVNFAIRVALSKLLTRRAGAKLQTLVIDEGFGTQDARGRDGIVEAIRSIEGDFQTILIITHINELKDAFPAQIMIEKTPAGSQIMVA